MSETYETFGTYTYNIHACITTATYDIQTKQLKHFKNTLATYMYSHCNICNIQINIYNIQNETYKTYT
jgi:hypothetical protein